MTFTRFVGVVTILGVAATLLSLFLGGEPDVSIDGGSDGEVVIDSPGAQIGGEISIEDSPNTQIMKDSPGGSQTINIDTDRGLFFKPLDPEVRESVTTELREVRARFSEQRFFVPVVINSGSGPRQELGQQIADILSDAGFESRVVAVTNMPSNPPPPFLDIAFRPNPSDMEPARSLAAALRGFISSEIPVAGDPGRQRGALTLSLDGDPLFSRDGRVTFR